jgi:hypothetical protein
LRQLLSVFLDLLDLLPLLLLRRLATSHSADEGGPTSNTQEPEHWMSPHLLPYRIGIAAGLRLAFGSRRKAYGPAGRLRA